MPVVSNGFYNDPSVGAAMSSIAQLFAPPSGSDMNAYAQAALARQKLGNIADLYANPNQPDFDRKNIAIGNETGTNSLYAVDQNNQTQRAKDAADNAQKQFQFLNAPIELKPNESTIVGPAQRQAMNLPSQGLSGPTVVNAGQTYIPAGGGAPIYGTQTEDQVKAAILGKLPSFLQQGLTLGGQGTVNTIGPNGQPIVQSKAAAIGQTAAPEAGQIPNLVKLQQQRDALISSGAKPNDSNVMELTNAIAAEGRGTTEGSFRANIGADQAKVFSADFNDAQAARNDLGRIQQLRQNIQQLPGGLAGGLQAFANGYGIKLGPNASNVEAATALINQLIPSQRQGLPGSVSDYEEKQFRGALPALSNTPQGNQLIMNTIEALAQQRKARGDIATQVMTNKMAPEAGLEALNSLGSPFDEFNKATGQQPAAPGGTTSNGQPAGAAPDQGNAAVKAGVANPSLSTSATVPDPSSAVPDIEKAPGSQPLSVGATKVINGVTVRRIR